MSSPILLESDDLRAIRERQNLINFKRFEIQELELAFAYAKSQIFGKYGLDPNGSFQIDDRGLIVPFDPTPRDLATPSAS